MADFNRIILIGNLTRDPEYKQVGAGALCKLGLASNRQFKNKQTGAMVQEVCFVDAEVWGPQAESCRQFLQKGRPVLVEGRLKLDTWQDTASGQNRSKHSIVADRVVFLGSAQPSSSLANEMPSDDTTMLAATEPATQLEKDLLDQIGQIKSRNDAKKKDKAAGSTPSGVEFTFKDEPPFKDELPF